MYRHILLPLDLSASDEPMLQHVVALAKHCGSQVTLVHIADGYAARYQEVLNLADSEEMDQDHAYLFARKADVEEKGVQVGAILAGGDPARQIVRLAHEYGCDLIAMGTHGHRGLADVVLGSVAEGVRHATDTPVLLLRTRA
jgi:nucleotide-binding universal stress UspA family protein